jgi:hypothetical protein
MSVERQQECAEFKREAVPLITQGSQISSQVAQEMGTTRGY